MHPPRLYQDRGSRVGKPLLARDVHGSGLDSILASFDGTVWRLTCPSWERPSGPTLLEMINVRNELVNEGYYVPSGWHLEPCRPCRWGTGRKGVGIPPTWECEWPDSWIAPKGTAETNSGSLRPGNARSPIGNPSVIESIMSTLLNGPPSDSSRRVGRVSGLPSRTVNSPIDAGGLRAPVGSTPVSIKKLSLPGVRR